MQSKNGASTIAGREIAYGGSNTVIEFLRAELAIGRRNLSERFRSSRRYDLGPNQLLANCLGSERAIYILRAGWAYQYRDLADGRRAIVDIYLPGDVVGLDGILRSRQPQGFLTITSVAIEAIHQEDALLDLLGCRPTALYIAWLLSQRQRRADQLLASISCLDARGRLAAMLLDFYTRLRRRKLVTGLTYNLPLTQIQVGSYIGLTVVHVNRILGSLREERIVQVEKHCVTILDLEQLNSVAGNYPVKNSLAPNIGHPFQENPAMVEAAE